MFNKKLKEYKEKQAEIREELEKTNIFLLLQPKTA